MNSSKILVGEFLVGLSFVSYAAIKNNYWPWPPTLVRMGIGFAVLGGLAMVNEDIAALLGAGFLIASFMKLSQSGIANYKGGVPVLGEPGVNITFSPLFINPYKKK